MNNGEFYRYYELSPVMNRNLLRVNLYSKVTTFAFRSRGKNTISSLDSLISYLSQLDIKAPIIKKPQIDEEDDEDEDLEEEEEEEEQKQAFVPVPQPQKTPEPTTPDMVSILGPFTNNPEELNIPFSKIHAITDWPSLHHRYKPENIPYLNKVLAAKIKYEEKLDHPDWKISVEDKKDGLTIWVRTTPEGLNAVKAQGIINNTPDHIFFTITNGDQKKIFDSTFDEAKNLEKIADQTYFQWQKVKKVMVVAARDFALIVHFNKMPNGTIYILAFDAGKPDLVPETKGITRASVAVSILIYPHNFIDRWLETRTYRS